MRHQNTANVRYVVGSGMYPVPKCSPLGFMSVYSIRKAVAPSPHIRIPQDIRPVPVISTLCCVSPSRGTSNT